MDLLLGLALLVLVLSIGARVLVYLMQGNDLDDKDRP